MKDLDFNIEDPAIRVNFQIIRDAINAIEVRLDAMNDTSVVGPQKPGLYTFADEIGDGTGNKIINGDYSSAEKIFFCQPPKGKIYRIARILLHMEITGPLRADRYGSLGSALTNGIDLRKQNDAGTVTIYNNGHKIKTNGDWTHIAYDVTPTDFGAGNNYLAMRFSLHKAGQYCRLVGDNNERFEVVLNDDFTGIIDQRFMIQGYIEEGSG